MAAVVVIREALGDADSSRYRAFLDEAKRFEGLFADVPTYSSALKVSFKRKPEAALPAGWVPLAALGSEEPQFLAVKADDDACPVAMWEHETGKLTPVSPTLDVFLGNLGKTASAARTNEPVAGVAELSKLVERGIGLVDGRVTKESKPQVEKVLAELTPQLSRMPSLASLEGGEYARLPERAWYAVAKMQRALRRFQEACDTLMNAIVDGKRIEIAQETLCDMLLNDLDQPERVVEVCEKQGNMSTIQRKTFLLALFQLDRTSDAVNQIHQYLAERSRLPIEEIRDASKRGPAVAKIVADLRDAATKLAKKRKRGDVEKLFAALG